MRSTQAISTVRPPPDTTPTYEPNQPDAYDPPALNRFERVRDDRYHFLLQKGRRLRPRYRPGWLNAKGEFLLYEDSLQQPVRSCFQIGFTAQLSDESVGGRVVLGTIAVAKQGIHSIAH